MLYVVDGNNLAGKLKLLENENFPLILRQRLLESHFQRKNIILVFDGNERMGDRQVVSEKFEVRFSPRDEYYDNADDYIVDLVRRRAGVRALSVVTDDRELISRVEAFGEQEGIEVKIVPATQWAQKLLENNEEEGEVLSDDEKDKITRELLKEWK